MAVSTGADPRLVTSAPQRPAFGRKASSRPLLRDERMEDERKASDIDIKNPASCILTSDLYAHFSEFASSAQDSLYVIAPFIRVEALNVVLGGVNLQNVTVVTTWNTRDVLEGATDLAVYPYLRSRGWHLCLHPGLHAKLLVSDSNTAIVTSANITKPGLGLAESSNVECALKTSSLSFSERLWLMNLVRNSLLVGDEYFLAFKRHVEHQQPCERAAEAEEFNDAPFIDQQLFLLSSLPMSVSPEALLANIDKLRTGNDTELSDREITYTLHDMALFALDLQASRHGNQLLLQRNFFSHPFIRAFADSIAPQKFFGEAKAWIQKSCANDPVPRRRDLTGHVRVLFDWFVALSRGEYIIKRPNYSECLVHVEQAYKRW